MRFIGIIVAMDEELQAVKSIMKEKDEKQIYDLYFTEGKIENKNCVIVKSGVGKVNAARVTQIMTDKYELEYIINMGSAGALNPMLEIGDIVIGKDLVQYDFDITAFGHKKGYITGVGERIYSDYLLLDKFDEIMEGIEEKNYVVKIGTIASGDIFCTSITMRDEIYANFDAECIEMEGAAIAQVCYLNNIPFIVIKSISDSPNGKNANTHEEFLELASQRCAIFLKRFLQQE